MRHSLLCGVGLLVASHAALASEPLAAAVEQHLGTAVQIAGRPASERRLADAMSAMHVPGVSVAVVRDGRLVWSKGYGVVEGGGRPVGPDTLFQAGSISKPIAALAVLRLHADGKVSLDGPVNQALQRWTLPDSAAGKAEDVTLRRLLAHVGGTNVHGFPGYARDAAVSSVLQILDGKAPANTAAVRITHAPGAVWKYSGGGYVIAQQLVADVTGQPFAEWTQAHWLKPAGMTRSGYGAPEGSDVALGHDAEGNTVPGGYHVYPEAAAAGLWTTPSDMARALIALRRSLREECGALLPQAVARVAVEPILPGHTVGFDTGGSKARWLAKGGDTEGYAGYLVFYPERGDGAVVLTNGAQGATLSRDVMRAIARAEAWPDFGTRVRHAAPIPATQLEALPGTYTYRDTERFTIARGGDALTIASPGEAPETLYRDVSGEFFTLSQDVAFVFDGTTGAGHIQVGDKAIAFRKSD
jgi:CubicO group peptidase (beta-lactamase class C family)